MTVSSKQLISAGAVFVVVFNALSDTVPEGFLEGHLKIVSSREVELADGTPSSVTAENYSDYPLVVLSRDRKKEVANVTVDKNGNYRVTLPAGDYVLDIQNHRRRHFRATPQPFTIVGNQTVRVDMAIDTGVR